MLYRYGASKYEVKHVNLCASILLRDYAPVGVKKASKEKKGLFNMM